MASEGRLRLAGGEAWGKMGVGVSIPEKPWLDCLSLVVSGSVQGLPMPWEGYPLLPPLHPA